MMLSPRATASRAQVRIWPAPSSAQRARHGCKPPSSACGLSEVEAPRGHASKWMAVPFRLARVRNRPVACWRSRKRTRPRRMSWCISLTLIRCRASHAARCRPQLLRQGLHDLQLRAHVRRVRRDEDLLELHELRALQRLPWRPLQDEEPSGRLILGRLSVASQGGAPTVAAHAGALIAGRRSRPPARSRRLPPLPRAPRGPGRRCVARRRALAL